MDTPAIPNVNNSSPNLPPNATAPWEKNRQLNISEPENLTINPARIITHRSQTKIHLLKNLLILIIFFTLVITSLLITGSYYNWPHPYPWPKPAQVATDKLLTQIPFTPLTSQIIIRSTLNHLSQINALSHRIIISTPQDQLPSFSQTLIGTTQNNPSQLRFDSLTQYNTTENNLQIKTDIAYSNQKINLQFIQQTPNPLLDLTSLTNGAYIDLNSHTSPLSDPQIAGTNTLTDIRNNKMLEVKKKLILNWQNNTKYISEHEFSKTHYLINWQTSPQEFSQSLKSILDVYRQTTSDIETSSSLDLIQTRIPQILTSPIDGSLLINKKTLFPEHIKLNTIIILTNPNGSRFDLPLEIKYNLNSTNNTNLIPTNSSDPLQVNKTTINQYVYSPLIQALALIISTPI